MATEEKRKIVMQLLAFDWSLEKIAAALSITPPTLRKNYFRELRVREEARARLDAKLLNALMKQVEAGNVSAIDKFFTRLDKHDLSKVSDRVANRQANERSARLGKKELQTKTAGEITGKYAPPQAPRLVN